MELSSQQKRFLIAGLLSAGALFLVGLIFLRPSPDPEPVDFTQPVREEPASFPRHTHMPRTGEGATSGSIDLSTFKAEDDIISFTDPRVWWESEHDSGDDEDDHLIHRSMEIPLKRLIELVCAQGGTLKVQDSFRPKGVHNPTSLHKEGRAIDITVKELTLEKLAKLSWASGFTWVLFEDKGGGPHIHCSVSR